MISIRQFIIILSSVLIVLSVLSYLILPEKEISTIEASVPTPDKSKIRVAVLNGCGREGLAGNASRRLRQIGFDVINGQGDNADSFDFQHSAVVDRKGNYEAALLVSHETGIEDVLIQITDNPYLLEDVTLVLGRDWDTLPFLMNESDLIYE